MAVAYITATFTLNKRKNKIMALKFNVLKITYLGDKQSSSTKCEKMICGCGWQDEYIVADTFRSMYKNHQSNKDREDIEYLIICEDKN